MMNDIDNCSFMGSSSTMKGLFFKKSEIPNYYSHLPNRIQIRITNCKISGHKNDSMSMEFLNLAYDDIQPHIYLENVTIYTNYYECWSVFVILYISSDTQQSVVLNNVAGSSRCSGVFGSIAFLSFARN